MFFQDLCVAPTLRPIKLRDDKRCIVEPYLINAIFVAIECEHAPIAFATGTFDGVEHYIRRESCVRCCFSRLHAVIVPALRYNAALTFRKTFLWPNTFTP